MAINLGSNRTIKFKGKKQNGVYPAILGGDSPSGTPSISSVTDNGDGTMTIQGNNFGTKDQAAPVLYDFVSKAYENGQENTFQGSFFSDDQVLHDGENETNRIWDGVASPNNSVPRNPVRYRTLSANTRHSNVSAYYEIREGSFVGLPIAYGGNHDNNPGDVRFDRPDGEKQLYVAWWLWVNVDPHDLYVIYIENLSGTAFQVGDDYRRGEQVIIAGAGSSGRDVIGWIHSYNSSAGGMILEIDTSADDSLYGSPNVYSADGSSFTAQTSAITGNLINNDPEDDGESFWRATSPQKYARFWETGGGSNGLRATVPVDSTLYVSAMNTDQVNDSFSFDSKFLFEPQSWNLLEILIDKGDNSQENFRYGRLETRLNGLRKDYMESLDPAMGELESSSPTMQLIGQTTSRPPSGFGGFPGLDFRISEVVQDKSWQRCVIADADTLSAATHYEIQRPTSWNDTGITAQKVEGALAGASQLYVFVANSDGEFNSTGVAI